MRALVSCLAVVATPSLWAGGVAPFTSEAGQRGLNYTMAPPPGVGWYGAGSAFVDLDGDGDEDIVVLGAGDGRVGVFENVGGLFVDHSATSGIPPSDANSALASADYNGDGRPDLFISRALSPSILVRNEGGFSFTNVTAAAGIATTRLTKGVAWGDYDNDGYVDLFLCNYRLLFGFPTLSQNQLYRNNGNGTFTDVAIPLGLASTAASLEAVWTDFDRDGDLDLYVGNDRGAQLKNEPNRLYRNQGNGTFVEVGAALGVDIRLCSMGLACGDLSGDGRVDFYCTNNTDPAPPLDGKAGFLESTAAGDFELTQATWGIDSPGASWGWGSTFVDVDNNGWLDLYVNNLDDPNALFLSNGVPPATNQAAGLGVTGSRTPSYCASFGDIDGDGDFDLLLNNLFEPVQLLVNHEGETRSWVRFRLVPVGPNTSNVGASGEVLAGGHVQYLELYAGGNSYLSQNQAVLHFGLGAATSADSAILRWPSGGPSRTLTHAPAGTAWTVWPPALLGDADGDGDWDRADRLALCGHLGAVTPGLERLDENGDFVLDGADVAFLRSRVEAAGGAWADLDGDGVVGGSDLALLLGGWGSPDCLIDLDGDGVVGGSDLAVLLGAWS